MNNEQWAGRARAALGSAIGCVKKFFKKMTEVLHVSVPKRAADKV